MKIDVANVGHKIEMNISFQKTFMKKNQFIENL